MPGYTHLQVAMPSSFGLWSELMPKVRTDMLFIEAAYRLTNRNPLGSAAGYGSSFPLNRQMTTDLLGFDSMDYNVVYAQMGRGKMERTVLSLWRVSPLRSPSWRSTLVCSIARTLASLNCRISLRPAPVSCRIRRTGCIELTRAKCNKLQACLSKSP